MSVLVSVGKQIESGATIVDAVSDYGAPDGGNRLPHAKAVDFVLGIRIFLLDEKARLTCAERPDLGFKIRSVLFGPIDLYPNANEKVRSHD